MATYRVVRDLAGDPKTAGVLIGGMMQSVANALRTTVNGEAINLRNGVVTTISVEIVVIALPEDLAVTRAKEDNRSVERLIQMATGRTARRRREVTMCVTFLIRDLMHEMHKRGGVRRWEGCRVVE